MAGTSLRDRFFTRQVARAITSPLGILLGGAVAAATIVAGVPLAAALPLGVAAWAGKVALSIPRDRRERIDPFTLQEPWRRYVQEALQARNRIDEAVGRTRPGPLRDHLAEIAARMHTGVDECWLIAKRGQEQPDRWVYEEQIIESLLGHKIPVEKTASLLSQLTRTKILEECNREGKLCYRMTVPLLHNRFVQQNLYLKSFR